MCKILFWSINQESAWPTKILMSTYLSFSDNLLEDTYSIFQNSVEKVWYSTQNMLNFGLGCSSPLKQRVKPNRGKLDATVTSSDRMMSYNSFLRDHNWVHYFHKTEDRVHRYFWYFNNPQLFYNILFIWKRIDQLLLPYTRFPQYLVSHQTVCAVSRSDRK